MKLKKLDGPNGPVFIKPNAVSAIASSYDVLDTETHEDRQQVEVHLWGTFTYVWGPVNAVIETLSE